MNDIAIFQTSAREDLLFQLKFNNIMLTGRDLSVELIERNSGALRETLTIGDGLALEDASTVTARLSKASMAGWAKGEYQADLLDITGGQLTRLIAVRLIYNEPGRLVNGVKGNHATINWAPNQSTVTAIGGVGPAGPPNAISIGDVDTLETGEDATASITGSAPNQALNLGLPKGNTGATGPAGTIAIGDVATGAPGSDVIIDNTGTPENAVLDITIPRGDVGATGAAATIAVGDVATGLPGSDAEVTNVGTSGAAIFNFVIPRGEQGPPGSVADGDKGDVTVSVGGTVWTLDGSAVASLNAFTGDSGSGGTKGLVPAPAAGDAAAGKLLGAGGGWVKPGVRYDTGQSLSSGERQQAQENIGASATGRAVLTATSAAAGRTAINAPPVPQGSAGVGELTTISATTGNSLVLPAGGTWAWWRIPRDVATNGFAGGFSSGVAAGGTTVSTGSAGVIYYGVCWRIA